MRKLKITDQPPPNPEIEQLLKEAQSKVVSPEAEELLLQQIREGNKEAIIQLVDSWETIILSVARQYINEGLAPKQMLHIGKTTLLKLAEQEVDSTHRERFFRFGAWVIKQAILEAINKIKNE